MSEQLLNIIKKAAKEAIDEATPSNIMFGTVTSISPLIINVEQKLSLTNEFLVLTKNVVDYEVDVSMDWSTETRSLNANHSHDASSNVSVTSKATVSPNPDNISVSVSSDASADVNVQQKNINLSHAHGISGKKSLTIHNALKNGDKVILIRQHGGQKYVVLDKIY